MSKRYLDGVLVDSADDDVADVITDAEKLDGIRQAREPLLQEADIAIFKLEDAGSDTAAWRTCRQALRDVTAQSDLDNISWPTKP
tara:strand:- start:691 stop:945 length:255 start_codon:yes stop_codon:yes gene_type:complete